MIDIMYFFILNYVYSHVTLSNPALRLQDPNKRLSLCSSVVAH